MIEQELGFDNADWGLELDARGTVKNSVGVKVNERKVTERGLEFTATNSLLTTPPIPNVMELLKVDKIRPGIVGVDTVTALSAMTNHKILAVGGLPEGIRYTLKADRQSLTSTDSGAKWADGITLVRGADVDQVEELRKVIGEKNVMFFDQ